MRRVGNHRWLAAEECKLEEVPVLWVDCDDEAAARIMIADNRLAEMADWDEEALADLLDSLRITDAELAGTGFTDADLAQLKGENFEPEDETTNRLDQRQSHECPQCGFEWRIGPRGEVEPV